MDSPRPQDARCLNCGQQLAGEYCAACGQYSGDRRKSFWKLLGEMARETFDMDSKLARTLTALAIRPGFLTAEYCRGRRASYTPPLRLYLFISVIFFLILALQQGILPEVGSATTPATGGPGVSTGSDDPLEALEVYPQLADAVRDYVPVLMFLLLPFFALLLKILYSDRLFVDHLIFSLHIHAIGFIVTGLMLPFEESASSMVLALMVQLLLTFYLAWYLYRSMRTVYKQSALRTSGKMFLLVLLYSVGAAVSTELIVRGALSYAGVS